MKFLCTFIFSLLMTMSFLHAEESINAAQLVDANEWQLGVTLGYGKLRQPVSHQEDIKLFIIPDIRYYGENFSIENLNLSYALIEQPNFVIELVGKQNFDGIYFPGDHRDAFAVVAPSGTFIRNPMSGNKNLADAIAAENIIPQHKSMSYMAGAEFRWYGTIDYFVTTLFDVSNVHNGYEVDLSLHFQHEFDAISTDLEVGLIHKSDKMSDYYYGVDYAKFKENNHSLSSTNSWYLQYTASYALSENWFALGVVKQQWQDSDIRRSPVIDRSSILSYFVGIKYMY
jgi:outer membrane protein